MTVAGFAPSCNHLLIWDNFLTERRCLKSYLTGMTSYETLYHNVGVVNRDQGRLLMETENLLKFFLADKKFKCRPIPIDFLSRKKIYSGENFEPKYDYKDQ